MPKLGNEYRAPQEKRKRLFDAKNAGNMCERCGDRFCTAGQLRTHLSNMTCTKRAEKEKAYTDKQLEKKGLIGVPQHKCVNERCAHMYYEGHGYTVRNRTYCSKGCYDWLTLTCGTQVIENAEQELFFRMMIAPVKSVPSSPS